MRNLILTGNTAYSPWGPDIIFCPSLDGLNERQADLAFVMPRIDHNRTVREVEGRNCWAAVLACDPFGSESAFFQRLKDNQYIGVTNWPSSILLEGVLRQSMSTIPATPEQEYRFLSRAETFGFQSLAFFLSLEQGLQAIDAGLRHLVLHPGLLDKLDEDGANLICSSLQSIINSIKAKEPDVSIRVYTTDFYEDTARLSQLNADGFVRFEQ